MQRFFFALLIGILLAGCGPQPETANLPSASPTAAVTATEDSASVSQTATTPPKLTPTPAAMVAAPTRLPSPDVDPYTLARQIVEQAQLPAPDGWQVEPCEGEAAVFCIGDGEQNTGYAELLLFPLDGYAADHPVRLAADMLPADGTAYTGDQVGTARQALRGLAEEHLATIADDRSVTFPDDTFTSLGMEPAQMGALPALTFGFVRTNTAGEVQERYLNATAFDRQFIYWFSIGFDPADVSTFVSDAAVTQFAPSFYEIAAGLPLGTAGLPAPRLSRDALALAMVTQAAASLPEEWRLRACYEAAGPFCWTSGQAIFGWAGLDIKTIADHYEVDDPLRLAAGLLPAPGAPRTAEQETVALQALTSYAQTNLQEWAAYQLANDPSCLGSEQPIQPVQLGPLPAVSYGYVCTDGGGQPVDQVRWAFAIDQQHSYLFQSSVAFLPSGMNLEQHTTIFESLAADMPLYDPALLAMSPLPPFVSYEEESGAFSDDVTWSLETELPSSPATVPVLSQPAQVEPLTAEQAETVATKYGFGKPLTVEMHDGLSVSEAAELGLFTAFDGLRTLSFNGLPYSYNDLANGNQGPDLPYAQAAPIAEQFLQENGLLSFPYQMAESDQGEGVLFLPVVDGLKLLKPAYGVRVAAHGGVAHMTIYPQDNLTQLGDYPILTADMAWPQVQFNRSVTSYRIVQPGSAVSAIFPTEYKNLPPSGEAGDFYTSIWAYQPLEGNDPPIIQSSDFYRVTGDPTMLIELAAHTDQVLHLWGTVHEISTGLLELELSRWDEIAVADGMPTFIGGIPMFFGDIQLDGGQTLLVDEANQTTYLLPDAPEGLAAGDYAAVAGIPEKVSGGDRLIWQNISVYAPQSEAGPQPTTAPIQAITITSVKLVYWPQSASVTGLQDNLFIPAWEFEGTADNGAQVTAWVTAVFPEYFDTASR